MNPGPILVLGAGVAGRPCGWSAKTIPRGSGVTLSWGCAEDVIDLLEGKQTTMGKP
jgi:hypothetical protein